LNSRLKMLPLPTFTNLRPFLAHLTPQSVLSTFKSVRKSRVSSVCP
jgi:hypothetical protein